MSAEEDAYAEWNKGLEPIEPLIEYYARQMRQLSGRLMAALSFLADLEDAHDWESHTPQVKETVHYTRLLIGSVLRMVAASQEAGNNQEELAAAEAIRKTLRQLSTGRNGKNGQNGDLQPE